MPFQTYDAPPPAFHSHDRLAALRAIMAERDLDAILVPHADAQRNEYLPANAERLAWISGFTGSAGAALVLTDEAILFVDGRYTLQAAQQADADRWTIESLVDRPPHDWLADHPGLRVGLDPWLVSKAEADRIADTATLVPLDTNPIDTVWHERPDAPRGAARIHPFEYAGRPTSKKLADIQATLDKADVDLTVLSDASSVSWLFNVRGADIAHTPLVLAHAIVTREGEPLLFVDSGKLDIEVRAFLTQVASLHEPSELVAHLQRLAPSAAVGLDATASPYALHAIVMDAGGTVVALPDPVVAPRSIKNRAEIAGARASHLRDGVAMVAFLAWLDDQPPGTITEIEAARSLEAFRKDNAGDTPLLDVSFDTISGSGPNGAIVHYRVTEATDRPLGEGELYLVDSGGQYPDGTTDITRTVAIGRSTAEHRRCFTLVLKGHIAIARARFPKGTRGVDLDVLARAALWRAGLDYAHGTGHGVGSALSVHEGPQGLSRRAMTAFEPGMIVSNEPGYYRTGAFGIRIENLLLVHEAQSVNDGDIEMLGFENLTLAPIDRRLIDTALLDADEIAWLDAYHHRVADTLGPLTDRQDWLKAACARLS